MSSVLENAVGAFLDALRERELDEPLRAVLRARGFSSIHFVHGTSELGRDFIARREEPEGWRQYAIQSKAGDLNLAAWQQVRNQIEDIRTGDLSHPGFDPSLPRVAVLVTTGRLVGDARLSAQTYAQRYADEIEFDVWDRDRLIEYIAARPDALLAGHDDGALLRMLGEIDADDVTDEKLERFSRRWLTAAVGPSAIVEAAVVAERLRRRERLDLACFTALALLRGAVAAAHGAEAPADEQLATADQATGLFLTFASELWERCRTDDDLLRPVPFVNKPREFGFFATYSVRCTRLMELLALLAVWQREACGQADEHLITWLRRFVADQPGCAHPLSDRHAVSLIPVSIALGEDRDLMAGWLREIVRWTADRYDDGLLGLAPVHAEPTEEVEYLLSMFEHIDRPRRRESYVAAVVLDLASILELGDVYDDARNDFLAVKLLPELLHVADSAGQYRVDGEDLEQEVNPPYRDRWTDAADGVTAPHLASTSPFWLERLGRGWHQLAVWSVLRDRHEPGLIRRLLSP